jgi:hypothetical protein
MMTAKILLILFGVVKNMTRMASSRECIHYLDEALMDLPMDLMVHNFLLEKT